MLFRSQILRYLHEHIQFDLPPSLLTHETRRALGELVQRNRQRGVPDEVLKSKEKELVEGAGGLAANRLKTNFILSRIAEEEKLKVTRAEIDARVREYAAHHQVPVEKMRKQLEENESINGLVEEILLGKTIDFLKHNVMVEKAPERPAEANVPEEKSGTIKTKITRSPCWFRWWWRRPAAANAVTISTRGF